ncbi:MAG: cytosolic protein [Syntrophomonadaceae bacterium]|nr:cytosolic protein [Syntrophomonadaceae bacterium]
MKETEDKGYRQIQDLNNDDLARLILNMSQRMAIHSTLWFRETEHQLGMKRALDMLEEVNAKYNRLEMERLGKVLGFEVTDGIPRPLLDMPVEKLAELAGEMGKNWLAMDGIWFQAIENTYGMNDAKRCNDSCWNRFSQVEGRMIKSFLGLPERAGLEGLKRALAFRMYARLNKQSIIDESPNSIVFQMNDCRVQSARKRKGLADYPCKSAGLVEYSRFAWEIDDRIHTECVGCPPDEHPEDWFCAWRFTLSE